MKSYTVVGFYPDNDQVFVEHARADNPKTAIQKATASLCSKPVIVDVFKGFHKGLLDLTGNGFGKLVFID